MFGRLSQLAQNVQNSFNADESGNADQSGLSAKGSANDFEKTVVRLQADLEQAEERNKSINAAFKKLLKEKEQEIKSLKEGSSIKSTQGDDDDQGGEKIEGSIESLNQLKRKTEEYQMLLEQKDQTIQLLMADVKEAEDIRDKVEQQERINTEKLMFELAERIRAHETIQRKLEETKHVMSEKDNAIHNMADQMAAQDDLLKAREDSIKKLKRMTAGGQASEEMIVTLQNAIQEKDNKLSQMAQLIDKLEVEKKLLDAKINNRDGLETSKDQTIKTLWAEIEQKNEVIQKISSDSNKLMSEIEKKDDEMKIKLDLVSEKESVIDELSMKIRSLEKELSFNKSDIEVSAEGASREINHLKNQLSELNEILKSKAQTIDMFQKENDEKDMAQSELRQKVSALQTTVEENEGKLQELGKLNRQIEKERDEYKEKYEMEANEKNTMKEKLDRVGSELSKQLDQEAQKTAELQKELEMSEEEKTKILSDRDNYANQLATCQDFAETNSSELAKEKQRVKELEQEVKELTDETAAKSSELESLRTDLEAKAQDIKEKDIAIEARDKEIQSQRYRFDEELNMVHAASENEKGNSAGLVKEMEHLRRELEAANQSKVHFEGEKQKLLIELQETGSLLEVERVNVKAAREENGKVKMMINAIEREKFEFEKVNESLKSEINKLQELLEAESQLKANFENEIHHLKQEMKETNSLFDEVKNSSQLLEEECNKLRELPKVLEDRNEELAEIKKENEGLKAEMEREREVAESHISALKSDYVELGEKVKEMETAMNHMVEKLNSAELQMNESIQENDSLQEKLRQAAEERVALSSQKSNIEAALEEFVRTTESRKKRSGRSSTEDSEGARMTPNEGLSGYSTPISKEGSPRNSTYLENIQPALQPAVLSSAFEGKAITEIFRLVEEERKTLEVSLASVAKERDLLSVKSSELEDYLELEKQKFKQASDEIYRSQHQSQQIEDEFKNQIYSLQEELSNLRYVNEEHEKSLEDYRQNSERLENELRQLEDRLADKTLELTRLGESCDQMQAELGTREEQLEKTTKQNKQMKNKLKELLKERAEKEKILDEREARIDELSGVSLKLKEAVGEVEHLENQIKDKDTKIASLEEEGNIKSSELKILTERVVELEEDANRLRETSAGELFAANEKTADLERSYKESEDIKSVLKEEIDIKSREVDDLNSISLVQKEELGSLKEMVQRKDEELIIVKNSVASQEQEINDLLTKLERANSSLKESEVAVSDLDNKVLDINKDLVKISGELESQKVQNTRQLEYISKLEEDLSDVNAVLSKTKEELSKSQNEIDSNSTAFNQMEEAVSKLKASISERDEELAKVTENCESRLQMSTEDLNTKAKEIQGLKLEKEDFAAKVKGLEEMLIGKDVGLREIVDAKNSELDSLKDESRTLNRELESSQKSVQVFEQRLAAAESDLAEKTLRYTEAEKTMNELISSKDSDISNKASEIAELTAKCTEKISLLEDVHRTLDDVRESLSETTKMKQEKIDEIDCIKEHCVSLENHIEELDKEKQAFFNDLKTKEDEMEELQNKLDSVSKVMNLRLEEIEKERQMFEDQLKTIQGDKSEGESQIIELMKKVHEITQEKDAALKDTSLLKDEVTSLQKKICDSEIEANALTAEKESSSQEINALKTEVSARAAQLEESSGILNVKIKELDAASNRVDCIEEENKMLEMEKKDLYSQLEAMEKRMALCVESDKESKTKFEEDLDNANAIITSLKEELQFLRDKEDGLEKTVCELEKSVSEKAEELFSATERLEIAEKSKNDLEEQRQGFGDLKLRLEEKAERCLDLEKQVEDLTKTTEQLDQEFEAERDMFAAKIAEQNSVIDQLEAKENEYKKEVESLKAGILNKEEIIVLKNEELENSKRVEKEAKEEVNTFRQELEEKGKHFEEYKAKVVKKIKSMKDETKKLSLSNEELKMKNARAVELESELETVESERQNLLLQVETHRQKIFEMENLNVSREENVRNFETEINRYHRMLQDKDEEIVTVKEMMKSSIEELQKTQTEVHKKEERIKILQEQLIANEEELSVSFTEKQNEIEELNVKVEQFERINKEKDGRVSHLSDFVNQLQEKLATLNNVNIELSNDVEVAAKGKYEAEVETSKLTEKVAATSKELSDLQTERNYLAGEISKLKDDIAAKGDEMYAKDEEIKQLRADSYQESPKIGGSFEPRGVDREQLQQSSISPVEGISETKYEELLAENEILTNKLAALAEENNLCSLENKQKVTDIELLTKALEATASEIEGLKSQPKDDMDEFLKPYTEQIALLQGEAEKKKRAVEEYKSKVSKRVKSLKEENTVLQSKVEELKQTLEEQKVNENASFSAFEKEKETLNMQLEELEREFTKKQESLDTSVSKSEEFQTMAELKANEADSIRTEANKLKQRLNDKEEEIVAVKEMMHSSMNDMQFLQDELMQKEQRIQYLEGKAQNSDEELNASITSLNEELMSLKEKHEMKKKEHEDSEERFSEARKQLDLLKGRLDARDTEYSHLQEELAKRGSTSELQSAKESESKQLANYAALQKESDAVKLKLAKAIKRLSTMKRDLQAKEELVSRLEEEMNVLKSSAIDQQTHDLRSQEALSELVSEKERAEKLVDELQRKDMALKELEQEVQAIRNAQEASATDVIIPATEVSVYADTPDGFASFGDLHEIDSSSVALPVSEEVEAATESIQEAPVEDHFHSMSSETAGDDSRTIEIEQLRKEKDDVSESLRKANEQFEKAKKKMAALKRAEIKSGKENKELAENLADVKRKSEADIADLQLKLEDIGERNSEKEAEISRLQEQAKALQEKLQKTTQLKCKLEGKNEDMKKLVEVMAEEKHELDDEMKDMLAEIKDVVDIKSKLLNDLDEAEGKLAKSVEECAELKSMVEMKNAEIVANEWKLQELESLEAELREVREEVSSLNGSVVEKSNMIEGLRASFKMKESECIALTDGVRELQEKLAQTEKMIVELQNELLMKEEIISGRPDNDMFEELRIKVTYLEEQLKIKDEEILNLNLVNGDLENGNKEQKIIIENLVEKETRLQQSEEELQMKLSAAKEELGQVLERLKREQEALSSKEYLAEEMTQQQALLRELNDQIIEKDAEIQEARIRFQEFEEKERELLRSLEEDRSAKRCLEEEFEMYRKGIDESFKESDNEKSMLNATIEELRVNNSEKEASLNQEVKLLREKLEKETLIADEKRKVERQDLVKSSEEKLQTVEELELKVQKFVVSIEHKDTVIAKLKLKLKSTIKDRDVMKGNLQSEIERLSHEKDVIFNEFQTSAQQRENEILLLKSHLKEMEVQNSEVKSELKAKETMAKEREDAAKVVDEDLAGLRDSLQSISVEKASLESRVETLESELEVKDELIEKFEWESSEKEDKIRDLQREARFFKERKEEWEELKRTFEDTMEVKDKIMGNLQKEIGGIQAKKLQDSNLKEEELSSWREENEKLKEQLQSCENSWDEERQQLEEKCQSYEDMMKSAQEDLRFINEKLTPLENMDSQICDLLGVASEEGQQADAYQAVVDYKKRQEDVLNLKTEQLESLEDEVKNANRLKGDVEQDFRRFKEEQQIELENCIQKINEDRASLPEVSIESIVSLLVSDKQSLYEENQSLSEAVRELQVQSSELEGKLEKNKKAFSKFKEMNYEEKTVALNDQVKEIEQQLSVSEGKKADLEKEIIDIREQVQAKDKMINKLIIEKENIEMQYSEVETMLDLAKLETQRLLTDKENVEKQLSSSEQETETLKSSTLPEMQSHLSAKNSAMLELRENFSEIMTEKDSVILTLRTKISELQDIISEGSFKTSEEIELLKTEMSQKDIHISNLTDQLNNIQHNRDWLQTELSQTIKEKNNIGGSIQDQFENISESLRGDIEMFMEDKKNFETEFQLERLQLERKNAEQQQAIKILDAKIRSKDKEIMELNFIVTELRRRVEDAAEILSKESYYHQLEERVEESYDKVNEANASVRDAMDRLREEKLKVEDLDMRLKLLNRERGEIVLVYEGKLQKLQHDHGKIFQSLRTELQEAVKEKQKLTTFFEDKIEGIERNSQFVEDGLNEKFAGERDELKRAIEELTEDLRILEEEKEASRDEMMNDILNNADEQILRLRDDYEAILLEKNHRLGDLAIKIEGQEKKLASLTESNITLSKNLFALEVQSKKYKKEITFLTNESQETSRKHKSEIEELLMKKGNDFRELRSQFEEVLKEKEEILDNLRNKVKMLNEQVEAKFQENNLLSSQKEELIEQEIKKDLLNEKLKVNVDSLLNSVFEITDDGHHVSGKKHIVGAYPEGSKQTGSDINEKEIEGTEQQQDKRIYEFSSSIMEAKFALDNYLQKRKKSNFENDGKKEIANDVLELKEKLKAAEEEHCRLSGILAGRTVEGAALDQTKRQLEFEQLLEKIKKLEAENSKLKSSITQVKLKGEPDNGKSLGEDALLPTAITDAFGVPRAFTGLQIQASEWNKDGEDETGKGDREKDALLEKSAVIEDMVIPTSSVEVASGKEDETEPEDIASLKEEIAVLRAQKAKAEVELHRIEQNVRNNFDDILQNLREDLQNSMEENRSLVAENFMLKNMDSNRVQPEGEAEKKELSVLIHADVTSQTDTKVHERSESTEKMTSLQESSAQTDVSFMYQPADDFKRGGIPGEGDHLKRYNSSDRLPEVVEDSLYSKMAFEQLQTFSDSGLEGESFAGHAKLELRLGEDTDDGDKSLSVSDLQSEVDALTAKVEQSKKLIVKLKQMSKKYKTELSELQAEKFEQIRVYEEAINGKKQEIEECNLEKVRKEQEIRGLREEVRVLVKEKAEMADSIKARIDAINEVHVKEISGLKEKNDQEFAKKDEVIRVLYNLKDEYQGKIENLKVQLHDANMVKEELLKLNENLERNSGEQTVELELRATLLDEEEALCEDLESRILLAESEKSKLVEKLSVLKTDASVDNAQFDEEMISGYMEESERNEIELREAFDLIRALENRQKELEEEYESQIEEMSSVIEAHEETIERMNEEKIEIEKSMQEMRQEVQKTVEEKDNIVEFLRNEKEKVVVEHEQKFSEKIQMSQMNIEECQEEIGKLRETVDSQTEEIEQLKARLNSAESIAKDANEKDEVYQTSLANIQGELERALQSKHFVEDRLAFFEHQVDGMRNEHDNEVKRHKEDLAQAAVVIKTLREDASAKEILVSNMEREFQNLKDDVSKGKKKVKRFKRDLETAKRGSHELSDAIRLEMEKVLSEVHEEKVDMHSDLLSKERELQELRIYADQLVKEKELWSARVRSVDSDVLDGKSEAEMSFSDMERLSLQVNQLKIEKDQVVEMLEKKISQLNDDYVEMQKCKREGDLKIAELKGKLNYLERKGKTEEKVQQQEKLRDYTDEVRNIKGDFEVLKKEASGFADASKMLFGQLESDLTGLIINAAKQQPAMLPKPTTLTSDADNTELRSLSPIERLSDHGYGELEEAKEQIVMLEDSLRTWKDRCMELEEKIQHQSPENEPLFGRRGSREFLINIDDEGPSIESARPAFGATAQRLMKYSTSGMRFKSKARSFISSLLGRQRGSFPVRRLLMMTYLLAIHVFAFVALYGFLS